MGGRVVVVGGAIVVVVVVVVAIIVDGLGGVGVEGRADVEECPLVSCCCCCFFST